MTIRDQLVNASLAWESAYGVAPSITSAISEYDAAILVGCPEEDYQACMQGRTAVSKGYDFEYNGKRYQVKANRPSGKPGSRVTLVAKAKNYDWDYLVWVHYTKDYTVQEAWLWDVDDYKHQFDNIPRLSPQHLRQGQPLLYTSESADLPKNPDSNGHLELTPNGRIQVIKDFLKNKHSDRYIHYSKERFYLDRRLIEQNNWAYLIIHLRPTEASANQGYKQGYIVVTRAELQALFGQYFKTQSWLNDWCYHVPKSSKRIHSIFIDEKLLRVNP